MYNGKYAKIRRGRKRTGTVIASLLLLLTFAASGTLAFLVTSTTDVANTFTPGQVTCQVEENPDDKNSVNFDGQIKENVTVRNTGTVDAYLRVKLISYRVNTAGQIIGGDAPIPPFTVGDGWAYKDGYYYFIRPVAAGEVPTKLNDQNEWVSSPLIGTPGITLEDYLYTFYDGNGPAGDPYGIISGKPGGGKQAIDVVAEAIQADGVDKDGKHPVTLAWGIEVDTDGNLMIK